MALQVCGLTMNSTKRELKAHGTVDFPCAAYSKLYTDRIDDVVFWHWHDELEIMYVRTGQLTVRVPQKTYPASCTMRLPIRCAGWIHWFFPRR